MKWLAFFKPKRKRLDGERGGSPDEDEECTGSEEEPGEKELAHKRRNARSPLQCAKDADRSLSRPSLDQWFEARRARTSIDINSTTTTERLTVCKAGVTTLINRTYIVIKHLGSGTYGQVKLAFNIRDHKLYAIKLCRKSQYGAAMAAGPSALPSPRASNPLSRLRRSLNGGAAASNPAAAHASGMTGGSQQQAGAASGRASVSSCAASSGQAAAAGQAVSGAATSQHTVLLPPPAPLPAQAAPATASQSQGSGHEAINSVQQGPQQASSTVMPAAPVSGCMQASVMSSMCQPMGPPPLPSSTAISGSQGAAVASANAATTEVLARSPFAAGGMPQQRPISGGLGGVGGQVGVQRLGPGSTPRFRYSSAAAGMLPPPPPAAGSPPLLNSPDSLDSTTSEQPSTGYQAPPAGAPPVFRKRPQGDHDGPSGMGARQTSLDGRRRAEEWVREIAIMKKLSHPNIVRLVEVIDDPGSDNLLLVMEYVEGVSLHPHRIDNSHWESIPEYEVWRRARDVIQGLDYLHYHGVVHGDLKPANLMLDTNTRQVKIVDFGSAVISNPGGAAPGSFSAFMGGGAMSCTPAFRSPESLRSGYRPSFELDMWAFGVTVYMWMFGQLPFNGAAPFLIYECIRRKDMVLPEDIYASKELRDFLSKVLDKDPARRLDVVGALNHPWITGRGTAPLPILQRTSAAGSERCACACDCMDVDTDAVILVGQQANGASTGAGMHRAHTLPQKRLRYDAKQARMLSQEELDMAISRSLGGHAISELMGMLFVEVHLTPRQQIIKAGDPVDTVYLITQGEVEIYQELPAEEATAAALLLGSSVHRNRILGTLGPSSRDLPVTAQEAATLSGTLHRLQPFAAEPMAVDAVGPGSGITLGSGSLLGDRQSGEQGSMAGSIEASSRGQFQRWLQAMQSSRGSGEFQGPSSRSAMDTDSLQQQQPGLTFLLPSPGVPPTVPAAGSHNESVVTPKAWFGSAAQPAQAAPIAPQPSLNVMLQGASSQQQTQQGSLSTANGAAARGSVGVAAGPLPQGLLTAAASSLAQPIISGLDTGHRRLFCGPHIKGFQKGVYEQGPGLSENTDDEEGDEGSDAFLDALVGSMAPLISGAFSSEEGGKAGEEGGGASCASAAQRRHHALFKQSSFLQSSGFILEPSGTPVVILAVKGPGDTLGFASLDSRHSAAKAGSSVTEGAVPSSEGNQAHPAAADANHAALARHALPVKGNNLSAPQLMCADTGAVHRPTPLDTTSTTTGTQQVGDAAAAADVHQTTAASPLVLGVGAAASEACVLSADTCGVCQGHTTTVLSQHAHPADSIMAGAATSMGPTPAQQGDATPMECGSAQGGTAVKQPHQQVDAKPKHPRPVWRANVRARGEVVAFKADVDNMHRLCKEFPELEATLKHMAVQQETDLLVSEALRQLRLVSAGIPQAAQAAAAAVAVQAASPLQVSSSSQHATTGSNLQNGAHAGNMRIANAAPPPHTASHMPLQQQMVQ